MVSQIPLLTCKDRFPMHSGTGHKVQEWVGWERQKQGGGRAGPSFSCLKKRWLKESHTVHFQCNGLENAI